MFNRIVPCVLSHNTHSVKMTLMEQIIHAQAVARGFLQRRIVCFHEPCAGHQCYNRMSADVPNDVKINVAVRRYLHALVTRKACLNGEFLNARTVLRLLKKRVLKFATYKSHPADTANVPRHYNYAWLKLDSVHGMHRAETPTEKRKRLAADNGAKKGRLHSQPSFITHDILSHIAKFLPVQSWAAMCSLCHGAGFCLPRNYLRKQLKLKLGYTPRDPLKALRTYSAARGLTNWKHKRTVVFSWEPRWANNCRHTVYDRIVHLWCSCKKNIHFVTRQGLCGTYVDEPDSIVNVTPMVRRDSRFHVRCVAVGHDGCICVVHANGMSIFSNNTADSVVHVPYNAAGTSGVACTDERNVFIVYGACGKVAPVCFECEEPHIRSLAHTPTALNASLMKASRTGVIWKSRHMAVCRMARATELQPVEILPRLPGRGRIVYISDLLPSGLNAVLHATGQSLTAIGLTDGAEWVRRIELSTLSVPITPQFTRTFSTAGDMVLYHEKHTRKIVAIRPESDAPIKPELMAFAQMDETRRRRGHFVARDVHLINDAVFVVEDKRRIVKYKVN